jgi:hypothetical protein
VPDGGGINVGVADGSSRLRTALVLVLPLDPVPRVGTQFFSMSRLPTSGLGGGLADWATGDGRLGRGRSRTGSGAGGGDHEAGGRRIGGGARRWWLRAVWGSGCHPPPLVTRESRDGLGGGRSEGVRGEGNPN